MTTIVEVKLYSVSSVRGDEDIILYFCEISASSPEALTEFSIDSVTNPYKIGKWAKGLQAAFPELGRIDSHVKNLINLVFDVPAEVSITMEYQGDD